MPLPKTSPLFGMSEEEQARKEKQSQQTTTPENLTPEFFDLILLSLLLFRMIRQA